MEAIWFLTRFKDVFNCSWQTRANYHVLGAREVTAAANTRNKEPDARGREYYDKRAIKPNNEVNWSRYKRLRNAVNLKSVKRKTSITPLASEEQDSKEKWKTLSQTLPRKSKVTNETKSLSATNFNEFFTTIAGSLCRHFSHTLTPIVLTPRVNRDFTLKDASPKFVKQEPCKLKTSKATGLAGIPARVLKDAEPEIAKPIAYLINLTILTGIIPQEWKEFKVTPIFKSGEKDDVNNYRPIFVLPLISKIMEHAV